MNEGTTCFDQEGYVCNYDSKLTFGVDDKLMERLAEWGIDTNPEDEVGINILMPGTVYSFFCFVF